MVNIFNNDVKFGSAEHPHIFNQLWHFKIFNNSFFHQEIINFRPLFGQTVSNPPNLQNLYILNE